MKKIAIAAAALMILGAVAITLLGQVPTAITQEDRQAAVQMMADNENLLSSTPDSFEDEVATIKTVQMAVLGAAPVNKPIAHNSPRELTQLIEAGHGLCFDRSRAIEKLLTMAGFKVRHVSVYSTATTGTAFRALLTPQVPSHALSEALTTRGWMVIDSNVPWIGLTKDGDVVGVKDLGSHYEWASGQPLEIFETDFTYVYGLYSRHGEFYEPYTPVPDFDVKQLIYNVLPG